jgi:hypothetical protein
MFAQLLAMFQSNSTKCKSNMAKTTRMPYKRPQPRVLRCGMESLERREVMTAGIDLALVAPVETNPSAAFIGPIDMNAAPAAAQATTVQGAISTQDVASNMMTFLQSKLGQRVGGGECAHMATEALRVSGAKFMQIGADTPDPGDYVWGTLVKTLEFTGGTVVDSNPAAALRPGDIIQYKNATFSTGVVAAHHTSVVAKVDTSGNVKVVYEQNMQITGVKGGNRTVAKHALDLSTLNGGSLRIYRAIPNTPVAGTVQFSILNNAPTNQTVNVGIGNNPIFPLNLTSVRTANSYMTATVTSSGTKPTLLFNGVTYTIANGAGYVVYTNPNGVLALRRL